MDANLNIDIQKINYFEDKFKLFKYDLLQEKDFLNKNRARTECLQWPTDTPKFFAEALDKIKTDIGVLVKNLDFISENLFDSAIHYQN